MSILLAQQKLILWLKSEVQKTKTELEQEEASEKGTDSPSPFDGKGFKLKEFPVSQKTVILEYLQKLLESEVGFQLIFE
jgi:hypothetical protein